MTHAADHPQPTTQVPADSGHGGHADAGAAAHDSGHAASHDAGHGDSHGQDALGPFDVRMWGVGLLGVLVGLVVVACFVAAAGSLTGV